MRNRRRKCGMLCIMWIQTGFIIGHSFVQERKNEFYEVERIPYNFRPCLNNLCTQCLKMTSSNYQVSLDLWHLRLSISFDPLSFFSSCWKDAYKQRTDWTQCGCLHTCRRANAIFSFVPVPQLCSVAIHTLTNNRLERWCCLNTVEN